MRVVIIEDEPLAVEKVQRYLEKSNMEIEVVAKLNSIAKSVPWITEHQHQVDLFLMDIQLVDGLSFDIFSMVNVLKPVIFITAFDEYAIDAFKVNSIDYLLKPVTFTALTKSLEKYNSFKDQFQSTPIIEPILANLQKKGYKQRFLVKKGNRIQSILTDHVAYFFAEGRDVFLVHNEGKRYLIEYTLEAVLSYLDESRFFRVNRSTIINIAAVADVVVYSNRRLKIRLEPSAAEETIVSREKVADFKRWFEGL